MKDFWRKNCTAVLATVMIIAIAVLLYIILSSETVEGLSQQNTYATADAEESAPPAQNTDAAENGEAEIQRSVLPRAGVAAAGCTVQTLKGSGNERFSSVWRHTDGYFLIVETDSLDFDFSADKKSVAVADVSLDGTLKKITHLQDAEELSCLSAKHTPDGLLMLVSGTSGSRLLSFDGEEFSVLHSFAAADEGLIYYAYDKPLCVLKSQDTTTFCFDGKQKSFPAAGSPLDVFAYSDCFLYSSSAGFFLVTSDLSSIICREINRELVQVVPTVVDGCFGLLTVERSSTYFSAFYPMATLFSEGSQPSNLLVLGRADNVLLFTAENGYNFILQSDGVRVLTLDGELSSPEIDEVDGVKTLLSAAVVDGALTILGETDGGVSLTSAFGAQKNSVPVAGRCGFLCEYGGKPLVVVWETDVSLLLYP